VTVVVVALFGIIRVNITLVHYITISHFIEATTVVGTHRVTVAPTLWHASFTRRRRRRFFFFFIRIFSGNSAVSVRWPKRRRTYKMVYANSAIHYYYNTHRYTVTAGRALLMRRNNVIELSRQWVTIILYTCMFIYSFYSHYYHILCI